MIQKKFRFVKVAAARPSGGELSRMALTGPAKLASIKLQSKDETEKKKRNNRQSVGVLFLIFGRWAAPSRNHCERNGLCYIPVEGPAVAKFPGNPEIIRE